MIAKRGGYNRRSNTREPRMEHRRYTRPIDESHLDTLWDNYRKSPGDAARTR